MQEKILFKSVCFQFAIQLRWHFVISYHRIEFYYNSRSHFIHEVSGRMRIFCHMYIHIKEFFYFQQQRELENVKKSLHNLLFQNFAWYNAMCRCVIALFTVIRSLFTKNSYHLRLTQIIHVQVNIIFSQIFKYLLFAYQLQRLL